jgi:hypothetical protein
MFKRKILLLGICLILTLGLLGSSLATLAQDGDSKSTADNITAYVMKDGKIHWLLPNEEMKGMTEEEYNKKYKMSAEEEAAIIHVVPPCPVIIDGIQYEPQQIHLFNGQQLGFTVGNNGVLYAFTTEEGMEKFRQQQLNSLSEKITPANATTRDVYSYFYEDWSYGGDFLAVPPGYPQGYIPNLGDPAIGMDNMISSLIVNSAASRVRLYDYVNLQGDYFERSGGTSVPWLFLYGWNDKASSLIVYN